MPRPVRSLALSCCLCVLAALPAAAGTISIAWDPVSDSDLAGYRVYYGTSPGSYPQNVDVGKVTATTLTGLADCTTWYVAVKAYDFAGNESVSYSNQISGLPRPSLATVSPSAAARGSTLDLTIGGSNFMSGATVQFGAAGIVVNSVTFLSCTQLRVNVTIGASTPIGATSIDVTNPDQVYGTKAAFFTVQDAGDSAPPVITPVTSTRIGGTIARISWTTNEPSDSQVFYRVSGAAAFMQTATDTVRVASHVVDLVGLSPTSTYEFYVRSADPSGNAASSTTKTFVTTSNAYYYLRMEAEVGKLTAPVQRTPGTSSFGAAWIDTPSGTPKGTATSPAGTSVQGVNLLVEGTWYLWVRMYGADALSDSWFESIDGSTRQPITAPQVGVWTWVKGQAYTLTAGLHSIELGGNEAKARADRILLTNDPGFMATEQPVGDVTPPAKATNFTATPYSLQVTLSWTNPSDTDFKRTIVRYRIDGRFPTSPMDGYLAVDKPATPGSTSTYVHSRITRGVTYTYSAFTVDVSGNVSGSVTAQALPLEAADAVIAPPGKVPNVRRNEDRRN